MDSNFTFGATAGGPPAFELDKTAKHTGGSKKLSYTEAMALAADDAGELVARLNEQYRRPELRKDVTWCGRAHWRWAVQDQHGEVYATGRTLTQRGGWRVAHRAYVAALTKLTLAGAGSAGYAADPACQHAMPFGKCDECPPSGRDSVPIPEQSNYDDHGRWVREDRPEMLSDRLGYDPSVGDEDWLRIKAVRGQTESVNRPNPGADS